MENMQKNLRLNSSGLQLSKIIKKFYSKRKKSETESIEDIEILRFFDLNEKIKMIKLNSNSIAVDEIADVKKAEKLLIKKNRA